MSDNVKKKTFLRNNTDRGTNRVSQNLVTIVKNKYDFKAPLVLRVIFYTSGNNFCRQSESLREVTLRKRNKVSMCYADNIFKELILHPTRARDRIIYSTVFGEFRRGTIQ